MALVGKPALGPSGREPELGAALVCSRTSTPTYRNVYSPKQAVYSAEKGKGKPSSGRTAHSVQVLKVFSDVG